MFHFIQLWGAILVGLLSAASIAVGAHISLKPSTESGQSKVVIRVFSFGVGAFFTAVCLDFLPDAWGGTGEQTPLWIFLGALILWLSTQASDSLFDRERNHQLVSATSSIGKEEITGDLGSCESSAFPSTSTLKFTRISAVILAASLSFHTFIEGAAVSLAFHSFGFKTIGFAFAMILHKLPEGVLWGLALSAVFPGDRTKIRRVLLIPAICTLIGVFMGIFLANQASSHSVGVAMGLVAGAMFYIALAELLPALRETSSPRLANLWFMIGLAVMFLLSNLSSAFGA